MDRLNIGTASVTTALLVLSNECLGSSALRVGH